MKSLSVIALMFALHASPLLSQGLQDGAQGSGGDEKAEYAIAVNALWNIVSVPIVVSDFHKANVFPTSTSLAFAFNNGYVIRDSLENGTGYWLKFAASQSLSLSGTVIYTDTLPVNPNWNMIGSISDPISTSSVVPLGTTIQSSFFSFDNGYQIATTVEPGKGYWVKAGSSGTLVLSSGSFLARRSVQDSLARILSRLNSIVIRDASGGRQELFFGSDTTMGMQGFFDLPPVPPAGAFDARFASGKMVALGDESMSVSFATYPVEIKWNIVSPGIYALTVDGKQTPLNAAGSMQLAAAPSRLSLTIGSSPELPKEFALSQNYPNPFNPTTTIKYDLPKESHVTLTMYNILGQEVITLVNEDLKAGYQSVQWNAGNVASGVYFYRLQAGDFVQTKKLLLLR